jgi:hypothetical protein
MILSKQAFSSFEKVKQTIIDRKVKVNDSEMLLLNEVYAEITGKPINKGCTGCMITVYQILNNWFEQFYDNQPKEVEVKKTRVRKPKA